LEDSENHDKVVEEKFLNSVYDYVMNKEVSYIDAILETCLLMGIDPEDSAKFITQPIKEKLMLEGQECNILPKTQKLPF